MISFKKTADVNDLTTISHANNFNFLRLMFAALVIVSHSPEMIDGNRNRELLTMFFHTISFGELAVNGFFILSGYLIIQSWTSAPNTALFLSKRVVRIYPAFAVATIISILIVGPLGAASIPDYFSQLWKGGIPRNIMLLSPPSTPSIFAGQPHPGVNNAMWTVHYEFICYLTVLGFGLAGILNHGRLLIATWAVLFLTFLLKNFGLLGFLGISADQMSLPLIRLLALFFSGMLVFIFRSRIIYSAKYAFMALTALFLGLFIPQIAEASMLIFGSYLIFFIAFSKIKFLAIFSTFPDASYGLYLYGWPIGKLVLWYFPQITAVELALSTLLLAYICGLLSWFLIEKPTLAFRSTHLKFLPSRSATN